MYKKFIRALVAIIVLLGVGFVAGVSTPNQAQRTVAYETTPGPYGSGVLGDWSGLSHGLYCFQPASSAIKSTSYTRAVKKTAPLSSAAMACEGEDVRIYGDSITFGGKSALAVEMNKLGLTLYVDAWSGRPTTPVADAVEAETSFPKDVIIASGTNDAFNPTVMAAQIQRILKHIKAVSPTTRVFWVDMQMTRFKLDITTQRNDQRNSMAINLAIYQNMPPGTVIQWTQRFMSNPNLIMTYLGTDGVHPTGHYDYWAAIVRAWFLLLGGGS